MLKGKKILLGVTGSIAAYKAAILVRSLVKDGAEVRVIMTPLAKEFITPLTLATLSKNPILVDSFDPEDGRWNNHVELGTWADLFIIAPATANTLAKMANGMADNLLLTAWLSARCPVVVAPAMDVDMFNHFTTQDNLALLRSHGVHVLEPSTGELASGLEGKGRMQEPDQIAEYISGLLSPAKGTRTKKKVRPLRVLITAGPTYEAIDPVRFIGNYSSGRMGFAIAHAFARDGHQVILVTGPSSLMVSHPNIKLFRVESAAEMFDKCMASFPSSDCAILSAAVADYTPAGRSDLKIRREKSDLSLQLVPTRDIAAELGRMKKDGQVTVGFALETHDELAAAKLKLQKKNLDFIVLNSLNDKGAGFQTETNKVTFIDRNNNTNAFPLKTKDAVAYDILNKVYTFF